MRKGLRLILGCHSLNSFTASNNRKAHKNSLGRNDRLAKRRLHKPNAALNRRNKRPKNGGGGGRGASRSSSRNNKNEPKPDILVRLAREKFPLMFRN
jgi:hypothetical protein